jgi:hypothetical protein
MLKNKAVKKTNTFAKTNAYTAVKTICSQDHTPGQRRTLARKFHRSAGAGTANAAVAAARQTVAVVIFPPVSIVPGSMGGISSNCTREIMVWPTKKPHLPVVP